MLLLHLALRTRPPQPRVCLCIRTRDGLGGARALALGWLVTLVGVAIFVAN